MVISSVAAAKSIMPVAENKIRPKYSPWNRSISRTYVILGSDLADFSSNIPVVVGRRALHARPLHDLRAGKGRQSAVDG